MKTAISVPDKLFRAADALARRLQLSRSALYAEALAEYVAKHRSSHVTERINAVLGSGDMPDPDVQAWADETLKRTEWK